MRRRGGTSAKPPSGMVGDCNGRSLKSGPCGVGDLLGRLSKKHAMLREGFEEGRHILQRGRRGEAVRACKEKEKKPARGSEALAR